MTPEYAKDISTAAYILPVGWLVAYAVRMVGADASEFTAFHLRQAFGLSVFEILCYVLLWRGVDNAVLNSALTVLVFILSFVGVRGVRKGLMRYQPLLGRQFDSWFSFIK